MHFYTVLATLLVLSIGHCAIASEVDLQSIAEQYVAGGHTPGIVIGVGQTDGSMTFYSAGTLEAGGDVMVDEDTIFEIGSVSKVFTTLLLAQMASENMLNVQDPIENHLPDSIFVPSRDGEPITFEHLATHTSGLPMMPSNFQPANPENPYADYTTSDMHEFLAEYEICNDPGDSGKYSNIGMGLLGHALEERADSDYETLITSRICEPLGMDSTVTKPGMDMDSRVALAHKGMTPSSQWDIPGLAGAGDINSSARDMLIFAMANTGNIKTPLHEDMITCHESRVPVNASPHHYGLGWAIESGPESTVVYHNGATGGFKSSLGFRKETGDCIVVLANSDKADTNGIMSRHLYRQQKSQNEKITSDSPFKQYVGTYSTPPFNSFLNINIKGERLLLQFPEKKPILMTESRRDEFHSGSNDYRIYFKRKNGVVNALDIHHDGKVTQYKMRDVHYPPESVNVSPSSLKRYVGDYKLHGGKTIFQINRNGNKIRGKLGPQKAYLFTACSEKRFFAPTVIAQISFLTDEFGNVYAMVLHQNGRNTLYTK
ncbi:MAG: serine hydrolase [Phycisphaerales bacterium]|nr:serine hydrolase [Phycisphaerales bacterium]